MAGSRPVNSAPTSTNVIAPTVQHQSEEAGSNRSTDPEVLKVVYKEICHAWEALTTVRFQILGFFLTGSMVALTYVLTKSGATNGLSRNELEAASAVGLILSIALAISELRNTHLYDYLVLRGKQLEEEMGVTAGLFRGRREPQGLIRYGFAATLIYGTTIIGWLSLGLYGNFQR